MEVLRISYDDDGEVSHVSVACEAVNTNEGDKDNLILRDTIDAGRITTPGTYVLIRGTGRPYHVYLRTTLAVRPL